MLSEDTLISALAETYPTARYIQGWKPGTNRAHLTHTLSAQAEAGHNYALLVPAATETRWFQDWCFPWEVLFPRGRIRPASYAAEGKSPSYPPAIIVMGPCADRATVRFVELTPSIVVTRTLKQ